MTLPTSPAPPSTSTAASTWPKGLELRLFGEPEFVVRGESTRIKFTRPRCIELLALCALQGERALSRAAICGLLWPDATEEDARANLRRHLSELSSTLAQFGSLLLVDRATVRWNTAADTFVDVIAFEAFASDPTTYDKAVELYRGDLLSAAYEDWLLAHRDRLRSSAVQMFQTLGDDALRARDYTRALECARRALELSEWREDSLRLLMSAVYASGNRAEALAEFDRFARTLANEMHVEPMHETLALRETILADQPIVEMLPSPVGPARDEEHPMVGRDHELTTLEAAWDRASRGAGSTIFVGGEAGIGKSRIMRELSRRAEERGGRALWSNASPDSTTTFQPLVDVVRDGMSGLTAIDLEDVWLSSLAEAIPELAKLRPQVDEAGTLDATRGAERLREGFARAVEAIARRRPALIVLEDLHWADVDTIEAIAHIARRIRGSSILLVLTHRSEETPLGHPLRTLRRTLLAEHRATMLSLGALAPDAIARLVDSPTLAADIARSSGGNPLFAIQMLRHHSEQGGTDTPLEMSALVQARLSNLDSDARSVLHVAALIDERFTVEELAEVAGFDESKVLASLDPLLDARYVRWTAMPGFSLTFSHQLLRDAVVGGMTREGRPALHRRIASVLERTRATETSSVALIARHFEFGGDRARAFERYLDAASAAARVYAFRSSGELAHHALSVAENDVRRADALRVAIEADDGIGVPSETYALDVDAFIVATAALGESRRFESVRARFNYRVLALDRAGAASDVEEMLAIAQVTGKRDELRQAYRNLGHLRFMQGETQAASEAFTQALALTDPNDSAAFHIRAARVSALLRSGKREEGLREFEILDQLSQERNDRELDLTVGIAHQTLSIILEETAVFEAAGKRLVATADRIGSISARAVGMSLLAHAAYQTGDVVAARKLTSELFEYVERHNVRLNSLALRQNSAIFEAALGNIDTAIQTWESVLADAERIGQSSAICCSLINIGEVLVARNESSRALPYLQRALDVTERNGEERLHLDAKAALGAAEAATGSVMKGLRRLREVVNERRHAWRLHVGDLCNLIDALLRAGLVEEATPYASELDEAYAANRGGVAHPMRVCLVLADAAEARGDAMSAKRYRFEGVTLAKEALERIPDEETRANFAAMPFNKRLLALNFGSP